MTVFQRYAKGFAALLGALTPAVVVGVLALFGVHIDPTLAAGICTVLAAVATVLAPANQEPSDATPPEG